VDADLRPPRAPPPPRRGRGSAATTPREGLRHHRAWIRRHRAELLHHHHAWIRRHHAERGAPPPVPNSTSRPAAAPLCQAERQRAEGGEEGQRGEEAAPDAPPRRVEGEREESWGGLRERKMRVAAAARE
jgi:hypothetical protein